MGESLVFPRKCRVSIQIIIYLFICRCGRMSDAEVSDDEIEGFFDVSDVRYNPIAPFDEFTRPLGLVRGLLVRGLRGGVLVLDTVAGQIYKPVSGRLDGDDLVCETLNVLWSMGERQGFVAEEKSKTVRHSCPGYAGRRCHSGRHRFAKKDLLLLYLRHRLRLRVLLARSTVSHFSISKRL